GSLQGFHRQDRGHLPDRPPPFHPDPKARADRLKWPIAGTASLEHIFTAIWAVPTIWHWYPLLAWVACARFCSLPLGSLSYLNFYLKLRLDSNFSYGTGLRKNKRPFLLIRKVLLGE